MACLQLERLKEPCLKVIGSLLRSRRLLYKNLGRLWLAYTELQGDFYMLQSISVDSRHFTHTSIKYGCGHSLTPSVNEKDLGHLWIECALHSYFVHSKFILQTDFFSHEIIRPLSEITDCTTMCIAPCLLRLQWMVTFPIQSSSCLIQELFS